jgi:hypothetical protein
MQNEVERRAIDARLPAGTDRSRRRLHLFAVCEFAACLDH